jgi:curved DNA-binding protein CbpA
LLIKDYYKILGVAPTASFQEIKRSFRQLAHKYHPDKNEGDHLATAQFREIQEAYEVLSDPRQREEYNYKRWYNRSIGQSFKNRPVSPAAILEECKLLQSYIASISIFHVNYDAVSKHIRDLLTEDATKILQQFNDTDTNQQIIRTILISTDPLPVKYLMPITDILLQLAGENALMKTEIGEHLRQRKRRESWDKYKWIVMVVVTALICWLMYIVGK